MQIIPIKYFHRIPVNSKSILKNMFLLYRLWVLNHEKILCEYHNNHASLKFPDYIVAKCENPDPRELVPAFFKLNNITNQLLMVACFDIYSHLS